MRRLSKFGKYIFGAVSLLSIFVVIIASHSKALAYPAAQQWSQSFTPGTNYQAGSNSRITTDSEGNVYVATDMQTYVSPANYYGVSLIKYNTNGSQLWDVTYTDPNANEYTYTQGIVVDSSGNVYTEVDSGTSVITTKYDTNGNQLWQSTYQGTSGTGGGANVPDTIQVDLEGNVYDVINSNGFETIKYSPSGSQLWAENYNIPGGGGVVGLNVNSSGNIYVVGDSGGEYGQFVIVSYDTNGNLIWANNYGTTDASNDAADITVDSSQNVYVTGTSETFLPSGNPATQGIETIKVNRSGVQQWIESYNVSGTTGGGNSLQVDSSGNVYVAGTIGANALTIKYDSSGNQLWADSYNYVVNDEGVKLLLDSSGNVYIGGPGYNSGPGYPFNYVVVKYDNNGNQLWVQDLDTGGADILRDMALDSNDNVYVTGYTCNLYNEQNCVSTTVKYVQAPGAPTNLSATSPTQQTVLSWTGVSNAVSYNIYRNGTEVGSITTNSYTDTTAPQGNNSYYVTAVGSDGLESSPSNTVSVLVDDTPPTITYTISPTPNTAGWNNSSITVTFNCSDTIVGIDFCSTPVTISTQGADQTVTGSALNNVGNTAVVTATVNIDKTPPTVQSYGPFTKAVSAPLILTAPASDNLSGVVGGEYFVGTTDPGQGNGIPMTYVNGILTALPGDNTLTNLPAGTYQLNVRAEDAAGNWSSVVTTTLTVANPAPVVGSITAPSTTSKGTLIDTSASFTDSGPGPDTASWNWGDNSTSSGTVTESNGSGSITGSHTYTKAGSYVIVLTVTGQDGETGSSQFVIAVSPSSTFKGANLSGLDYSDANLSGLNMTGDNLQNTTFNDTDFAGTDLAGDNGNGASFQNANFTGADLAGNNFTDANLSGAILTNTDLAGANLTGANLTDANLTGANLKGANFKNATMTGVTYSNTTCPNNTNSNNDGGTCVGRGGGL